MATSSQLSALADVNKTMEEAAKADSKEKKTDNKDTKTDSTDGKSALHGKDSDEKVSGADTQGEIISGSESVDTQSGISVSNSTEVETTTQQPVAYVSVDIRL